MSRLARMFDFRSPSGFGATTAFDRQGFQLDHQREAGAGEPKIRCPKCRWQPTRQSRWFCAAVGAPEYFDGGCGHSWNTFDTGGRCPGCRYQWQYTSCLSCSETSLHVDWYEESGAGFKS